MNKKSLEDKAIFTANLALLILKIRSRGEYEPIISNIHDSLCADIDLLYDSKIVSSKDAYEEVLGGYAPMFDLTWNPSHPHHVKSF